MKTENWNGHEIRFVEKGGAWRAVAQDIETALAIQNIRQNLEELTADGCVCKVYIPHPQSPKKNLQVLAVNELGVYSLIMRSNKPEAKAFQKWVFNLLKSLREALGYEQWKLKAFTDSVQNHHLNMTVLKEALNPVCKVPYIKAQTIVNKCMANIAGEDKAIGKDELKARFPDMLPLRDKVLADTVRLMEDNGKFGLGLSVSEAIYRKYGGGAA
jgi:prophage antirepressor-like protein